MSKFDELEKQLAQLHQIVSSFGIAEQSDEIDQFLMSAVLKIWAPRAQYSKSYAPALRVLGKKTYRNTQIVAAIEEARDPHHPLIIPAFFQQLVQLDKETSLTASRDVAELIGLLLVEFALINDDFTIEEANAIKQILDQLNAYCDQCGIGEGSTRCDYPELITASKPIEHQLPDENEIEAAFEKQDFLDLNDIFSPINDIISPKKTPAAKRNSAAHKKTGSVKRNSIPTKNQNIPADVPVIHLMMITKKKMKTVSFL